jgi:hypothetical protein
VEVRNDEGVAIRIGPEPCVAVRKDVDEASVGEGAGQPLSPSSQRNNFLFQVYPTAAPGSSL